MRYALFYTDSIPFLALAYRDYVKKSEVVAYSEVFSFDAVLAISCSWGNGSNASEAVDKIARAKKRLL